MFKVPARYICGYDPCSGAVCKADPAARCLVEHTCKAMFVNSFNQRMGGCKGQLKKMGSFLSFVIIQIINELDGRKVR